MSINLTAQPVVEWQKTYGGSLDEELTSAQQTVDGGYILARQSDSDISGDRTEASRGWTDYWLVKTSADGTLEWEKRYGGSYIDLKVRVKQTPDGGYNLSASQPLTQVVTKPRTTTAPPIRMAFGILIFGSSRFPRMVQKNGIEILEAQVRSRYTWRIGLLAT